MTRAQLRDALASVAGRSAAAIQLRATNAGGRLRTLRIGCGQLDTVLTFTD